MNSSVEFAACVRQFAEMLGLLVWASFQRGLEHDREWPEEDFFATLVDQGFRGGHPQAKRLLDRLDEGGRYSLRFQIVKHSPRRMEPLTGADLAFITELQVDGRIVTRRVSLVQLKKAADSQHGAIGFPELHHKSGQRWFGKRLHQAERMLLFTQCAVFWLAVPPNPASDEAFLKRYVSRNSFAARRRQRRGEHLAGSASVAPGVWPFFGLLPDPRYYRRLYDFLMHFWPGPAPPEHEIRRWHEQLAEEERDRILRTLWADLALEASRLHGMRSRMPVLVTHAESVLRLGFEGSIGLNAVYRFAVSLPEFLLGEVLRDGFGDENQELIDALMQPRPGDYIKEIVRRYVAEAALPEIERQDPVRAVIRAQLSVTTPAFPQG
jgi:DNA-directed RNA polymerase subunit H (RpoH/RPB5)